MKRAKRRIEIFRFLLSKGSTLISNSFHQGLISNADLSSLVIVRTGQIAYCDSANIRNMSLSHIVPLVIVLFPLLTIRFADPKLKHYAGILMMWLIRSEFERPYVAGSSAVSAYERLDLRIF